MLQFIRKSFVYLAILLLLSGVTISLLLRKYPEVFLSSRIEYFMWNKQVQRIKNTKYQHINAILGDSRAMAAINPCEMSKNYYNFALGGSSFFEGYVTLKTLLKTNRIDTLILCYAPIHYEQTSGNLLNRTVVFDLLENKDIQDLNNTELRFNASIEHKKSSAEGWQTQTERYLRLWHFPFAFRSTILSNYQKNSSVLKYENEVKKELDQYRGHVYFGRAAWAYGVAEEARETSFVVSPVIHHYFDEISKLITNNNIKCFLVTPPMSKNTYNFAKPAYIQSYKRHIQYIKSHYPQLHVDTSLTVLSQFHFGDVSHVNVLGSRKFMQIFPFAEK
jgi:hypothetical protein